MPVVQRTFEWHGGHPALDLVNTLDERLSSAPIERLGDYAALVDFTVQAGLIDESLESRLLAAAGDPQAHRVLAGVIQLREALYQILRATLAGQPLPVAAAGRVQGHILAARRARRLSAAEGDLGWIWPRPCAPDRPLWELALAVDDLLVRSWTRRIKECAAHDCGVLFLDQSRARSRRWCSMQACGNRAKVRRHRARQARLTGG